MTQIQSILFHSAVLTSFGLASAAELSGRVFLTTYRTGSPSVDFPQFLTLDNEPGQLSEPTRGRLDLLDFDDMDVPLSGTSQYSVDWRSRVFSNGTWFFRSIQARTTSKKSGPQDEIGASLLAIAEAKHSVRIKLIQRQIESGDNNYSGIGVKLRFKIKVSGESVTEETKGDLASEYTGSSFSASFFNPMQGSTAAISFERQTTGSVSEEGWATPIDIVVDRNDATPELVLGVNMASRAANGPNYSRSQAELSVRVMVSDFQVLDSSGAVIWDYAPNADGSPGDKWVLQIYDPSDPSPGHPSIMALGEPPPFVAIRKDTNGDALVDFSGVLEESSNLIEWSPVHSSIFSPYRIPSPLSGQNYYRAHSP
jgi:hypothetical protein